MVTEEPAQDGNSQSNWHYGEIFWYPVYPVTWGLHGWMLWWSMFIHMKFTLTVEDSHKHTEPFEPYRPWERPTVSSPELCLSPLIQRHSPTGSTGDFRTHCIFCSTFISLVGWLSLSSASWHTELIWPIVWPLKHLPLSLPPSFLSFLLLLAFAHNTFFHFPASPLSTNFTFKSEFSVWLLSPFSDVAYLLTLSAFVLGTLTPVLHSVLRLSCL